MINLIRAGYQMRTGHAIFINKKELFSVARVEAIPNAQPCNVFLSIS